MKIKRLLKGSVYVFASIVGAMVLIGTFTDPAPDGSETADCAPPDPCWGDLHYDDATTPCWRAIEARAAEIGRWDWDGIGRLTQHRSLPNGNVLYYGDIMKIIGPDGIERNYHYSCTYFPQSGDVAIPVLEPGSLPQ